MRSTSYNLGHNWLRLFSPIQNSHIIMINSMLNHVAFPKPPQLNVELVSWYITKRCFGVAYNIELGGGKGRGETKFVLVMFINLSL